MKQMIKSDKSAKSCINDVKNANTSSNLPNNHAICKKSVATGIQRVKNSYIAMDCEFVGCGIDGKEHQLARVSIVDQHGTCIYDNFVAPKERITDFRTSISGIRPKDVINAAHFITVQREVDEIIKDKLLIGHSIKHDLQVLCLSHPRALIRDTATYLPFRALSSSLGTPSLQKLADTILGLQIQQGEHNSIEDARAALMLYKMHKREWERSIRQRSRHRLNRNNRR